LTLPQTHAAKKNNVSFAMNPLNTIRGCVSGIALVTMKLYLSSSYNQ